MHIHPNPLPTWPRAHGREEESWRLVKVGNTAKNSLGINLCFNSCLFSFWSELSSDGPRGQNEQINVRSHPLPPTALIPVPCGWLSQDTEVSMVFPPKSEPCSALPMKFMFSVWKPGNQTELARESMRGLGWRHGESSLHLVGSEITQYIVLINT